MLCDRYTAGLPCSGSWEPPIQAVGLLGGAERLVSQFPQGECSCGAFLTLFKPIDGGRWISVSWEAKNKRHTVRACRNSHEEGRVWYRSSGPLDGSISKGWDLAHLL